MNEMPMQSIMYVLIYVEKIQAVYLRQCGKCEGIGQKEGFNRK